MIKLLLLLITCYSANACNSTSCENGICKEGICICCKRYITVDKNYPCEYEQYDKFPTILATLFFLPLGIEYFYLARGNAWYIFLGVCKLTLFILLGTVPKFLYCVIGGDVGKSIGKIVGSCLGAVVFLWWLISWIVVVANGLNDGNDVELFINRE